MSGKQKLITEEEIIRDAILEAEERRFIKKFGEFDPNQLPDTESRQRYKDYISGWKKRLWDAIITAGIPESYQHLGFYDYVGYR